MFLSFILFPEGQKLWAVFCPGSAELWVTLLPAEPHAGVAKALSVGDQQPQPSCIWVSAGVTGHLALLTRLQPLISH